MRNLPGPACQTAAAGGTRARGRVSGIGRPMEGVETMIDRITGQSLLALLPSLVVIALAAGPSPSRAVDQEVDQK